MNTKDGHYLHAGCGLYNESTDAGVKSVRYVGVTASTTEGDQVGLSLTVPEAQEFLRELDAAIEEAGVG